MSPGKMNWRDHAILQIHLNFNVETTICLFQSIGMIVIIIPNHVSFVWLVSEEMGFIMFVPFLVKTEVEEEEEVDKRLL